MRGFSQVDVFSSELGFGNPLAVIHDAEGMTEAEMLRIARWTNLSETTFLTRPSDTRADYGVRIFTPMGELPFAGHPTLGSAHAWLEAGGRAANSDLLVQECPVGLVRIRRDGHRLAFAAPPLLRSGEVTADDVSEIVTFLGIERDAVVDAQWVDNGPGWVAVLLNDADSVLRLEPRFGRSGQLTTIGVVGPHAPGSEAAFEVRAFVLGGRDSEDPVTGSLNASLAQWLIDSGRAPESYVAAQGTAIGRRGRAHINKLGADIWVGGDTLTGVTGLIDC